MNQLSCEFVVGSYSQFIREFIVETLSDSRIQNRSIIILANWLWIHYSSRELIRNSLGVSRIYFEIIILFANSPSVSRLYSLFCEYTKNSLFILWTHYGSIIVFANWLSFSLWKVVSKSSRAQQSPKSKINRKKKLQSLNICILYTIVSNSPNCLFLTSLTQVWPLMIFIDLIWPQIRLHFNLQQNSESKHTYIWDFWTTARLTPIGRIWPIFDLWRP